MEKCTQSARKKEPSIFKTFSFYVFIFYQYQTKSIFYDAFFAFAQKLCMIFIDSVQFSSKVQFWISWIIPISKNSLCPLPWIKLLKLQWQMPNMKCMKTALIAPPLPLQLQFPSNKNLAMMKPIRELQSRSQFFLSNSADTLHSDFESWVKLRQY